MIIINLWEQYSYDPFRAILLIVGVLLGILMAIAVHEYAHAWEANRLGDDTAKRLGRLTINPLAHIDPTGLFLFILAGFGYSKPVPFNPNVLKSDKDEIKIAIAGPISNIILALILALPYRISLIIGLNVSQSLILTFLDTMVYMNLVLAIFNFIPIPPLDGSRVLNYFLAADARESWERIGPLVLAALIFASIFFGSSGFDPIGTIMTPLLNIASFIVRGAPILF